MILQVIGISSKNPLENVWEEKRANHRASSSGGLHGSVPVVVGEGVVTDIRLCSMLAYRTESSAVLCKATQSARNQ